MAVDIEAMRQRLERLREQSRLEKEKSQSESAAPPPPTPVEAPEASSPDHSIFVGSVDFSVRKEELMEFFENCGQITRCTIQADHFTHKPKGYAYIEFADLEGVENALKFDGHFLKSRNIQVRRKRQNSPKLHPRRRFRRP
jgi:polyadenylate-binding protein 2